MGHNHEFGGLHDASLDTLAADDSARALLLPRFEAMRRAHDASPHVDWPTRERHLKALRAMLHKYRNAFARAIDEDFGGRSAQETDLLELFPSVGNLRHALAHTRRWMRGSRGWAHLWLLPARRAIVPQPLGVVGVIAPWNYPVLLAVGPLTDALAAGNRVMIKVSEVTPRFAEVFAAAVADTFAPEWVSVVTGDAQVARAFSTLPFDHLLFTGATSLGHHVMRAASENLTPVTLELGGKSPAIVGPGARWEHAVERIMYGKLVNAGQTCVAPDYVLVPREKLEAFISTARQMAQRLYPDAVNNPQYTSIVSPRHFERLSGLASEAAAQGATLHAMFDSPARAASRRLPPVLLTGVHDGMRVMREEIFGPLLPVVPYDDLDAAIAYVNERPRPLALYVFDTDDARVARVLTQTISGGVTVNDTLLHVAEHTLPFGGVGPSGMGGYHGEAGFRTFSKDKPIFRQARWNGTRLLNPPYGKRFATMIRQLLR
ncbi:coniferyl aldehyde dehydrogenase [Pandoraea nosoerga]|uniref:Aldehyde dehydrogenase n=2 Tax=Pandoraea nosoerga TaxID=2508296 RepID=A0A5E4S849_9BURK|nr:coniferyl aldehyde dehydrogenase [Pandoraea nosoerga]MBN4677375.1 coniferyl aldehyde dehydrogenase [Pandoraea nosoerga]MBN4682235.1 coniferyl aldehyde dehydrogenase [Pandoraea nosoerga]MBN4746496.1 coniferyl aldehyde dehydrogenase [Pandoraea nosoerga]VVD70972.1 Coniferyl aldehyde dehydrogenase [Pandoraea nosoerga]